MSKTRDQATSHASNGGGAGGAPAASAELAVSKFAGHPGTLTALRIDYTAKDRAFAAHAPSSSLGKVRKEVRALSSGPRLGDRPLWTTSSATTGGSSIAHAPSAGSLLTAIPGLPQRPLMSQNSAYQAVKLNYNYRADALPPVKELLYIPKAGKMELDRTPFLTHEAGKSSTVVITDRCLTTVTGLSRCEHQNTFDGRKSGAVRPLSDTFGAHVVRRHMALRGPAPPRGSSTVEGGDDGHSALSGDGSGIGSVGFGNSPLGASALAAGGSYGCPTLRERRDMDADDRTARESGWNASSALPKDRTCIYKLREYKAYRPINRQKEGTQFLRAIGSERHGTEGHGEGGGAQRRDSDAERRGGWGSDADIPIGIDATAEQAAATAKAREMRAQRRGVYSTPIERQAQISHAMRQQKEARRAERQQKEAARDGAGLAKDGATVFKMSNKAEWWSAVSADVEECRARLAAEHVKAAGAQGPEGDGPLPPGAPAKPAGQAAEGAAPPSQAFIPSDESDTDDE